MGRTQTIFVNLERLNNSDNADTIIRLMMACNDITVANQCLSKFKSERNPISKHVQKGALMYFVRLQCGHLNEAMQIVEKIRDTPYLNERVKSCSKMAQNSFLKLTNCLYNESDYADFQKYVGRIRHNTAFHYCEKPVKKALSQRSSRPEACVSKITGGDHIALCRFELADDILDSIVCRQLWQIPIEADLRKEADKSADFGSNLCINLLNFAGEFISRYIREHAAL